MRAMTGRMAILALAAAMLCAAPAAARPLVVDDFAGADGLVTNERVVDDEDSPAPRSRTWLVTSGSLFRRDDWGWTGTPDARSPDVCSCRTTGSAVFRMVSRRSRLGDVSVRLRVRNRALVSTGRTPPRATDGLHLMLRYRSERETYYVSIDRRDGHVTIKRKTPGGPSNGGTYVTLADNDVGRVPFGRIRQVRADVRTVGRAVRLGLWIDGRRVVSAVDRGQGPGTALRRLGRIGFRADNDDVEFDDVRAIRLR
jgi:hypothetical protein